MTILPDYWLTRPPFPLDAATRAAFDRLYDDVVAHPQQPINYALSAPKWQFLCYLGDQRNLALHGSGKPGITRFEPRQPSDLTEFGNQLAVYASLDALWSMFFAIVDRHYPMSLVNGCVRFTDASGQLSEPYYQFSVSHQFLPLRPWRNGVVYLLPRDSFVQEPPIRVAHLEAASAQLASFTPVDALASLAITPDDFPFLDQIRGHDDARIQEYVDALETLAPWPS